MNLPARLPALALVAAFAAAIVGALLAIGGIGTMVAVLSSSQPASQIATAGVLLATGAIDILSSVGIRRRRPHVINLSGAATAGLLAFLAVALHDFGEIFWLNVALLLLLVALRRRTAFGSALAV